MEKLINNVSSRYLDKDEVLNFKRVIIDALLDVTKKTDVGYYYWYTKISNIINTKIDQIFISNDNVFQLLKLQDKTLILDKIFSNLNFKNISFLDKLIYKNGLLIRIKELGLNLIGSDDLDLNFKDSIALYFANYDELKLCDFYHRKYYTSLPFLDLRINIINTLNIFIDSDLLAQTLCYGDFKVSEELDKISNHRGILKTIIKSLNKISVIQDELLSSHLRYKEIEDLYFSALARINSIIILEGKDKMKVIEEIYDSDYSLMDIDVQRKLIRTMHIYDAWNKADIEDKMCNSSIANSSKNFVLPENKNFLKKLECILNLIKEDINKILQILDQEYIRVNDFIVKNVLMKYLKSKKIVDLEESEKILKAFDYKIRNEYSYLEETKTIKKLRKQLNK